MASTPTERARTGFFSLDEAPRKAPKTAIGSYVLKDPTYSVDADRNGYFPKRSQNCIQFQDIDKAYDVDSYVKAGIDKYVELCVKQGWKFDCETPEPVEYLERRFKLMAIMTEISTFRLITELVQDYIKYGNAFWIKARQAPPEGVDGLPTNGINGNALPVLGYFRADPKRMSMVSNKTGKQLVAWKYQPENGKPRVFSRQDIIHFPFNVQAGQVWGSPSIAPVLDDIRAFRQCEEYVIRLLYKHLNPLMHHEVPDNSGDGVGRQEDLDAAYAGHTTVAPDGFIITPPGHKISMIGAESRALRGEGYIKLLRERIYAGLGLNAVVLGEGEGTSAGSADTMTATMHNRAKLYQKLLAEMLTDRVIYELLIEGGFDPLNDLDHTKWVYNEIEVETQIARENHVIQLYTNNLITEDEARRRIGDKPLTEEGYKLTYVYRVKIPEIEANADAKALAATDTTGTSGPKAAVGSKNNPSNQHGPRGAPKVKSD
jgi:hypothetical protein